jgi:hypothetical protein
MGFNRIYGLFKTKTAHVGGVSGWFPENGWELGFSEKDMF